MATPQVPPHPLRNQNMPASSASMDIPRIPPRPKAKQRSTERSVSPNRDTFARSPLNDPAFLHNSGKAHKETAQAGESIRRPPSVTLPSIGQEGMEYANLSSSLEDLSQPELTKNVAGDLPLHQPKASVPASTAKSRIQTVTRTDSSQAAAVGIGKFLAESERGGNTSSAQSESSVGTRSRPQSIYKDGEEHGIPEIGLQVPMYPNAGDVQAPTPSPYPAAPSTGVGYFNNVGQNTSSTGRHHVRTKSGNKQLFNGPPGSYGMHGHGVIPQNHLEKSWYEKHPEDAAREMQGEYGPAIQDNRKEWHMSKEDLNKLVRESATRGIGMGTSREAIGTPDEEIGYRASEEYASRMASSRPSSRPPSIIGGPAKQRSGSSQTHAESPLRNIAFPANALDTATAIGSENALESELEDDVIHIDPPSRSASRLGGGGSTHDLTAADLNNLSGSSDDETHRTPILAADEVAKHPPSEFLQPAVSPELERRGSGDHVNDIPTHLQRKSNSRNNNTPGLSRISSNDDHERQSTSLEDVQEYEPLFPDDSDEEKKKKQPKSTTTNKPKRPDIARHHFPSQDVWEDTPSSLQLQTTVETPDLPEKSEADDATPAETSETVDVPASKKSNIPEDDSFLAQAKLPPHMQAELSSRPGMAHRFPSQDIWEDAPEHVYQYTTVETPGEEPEEATEVKQEQKPEVPARPSIPARPQRSKPTAAEASIGEKKAPIVPERPKPQVPIRPTRPLKQESPEDVPLSKTTSASSTGSDAPVPPKTKPAVPARPGGSKIAALKAGFMNDLNQKLGLGPQAPKVKEPEKEPESAVAEQKAPLSDARKGRAKGPQRRKPTASPSPAATLTTAAAAQEMSAATPSLSFATTVTIFSIADDGILSVPSCAEKKPAELEETAGLTAEEEAPPTSEPVVSERADIVPPTEEKLHPTGETDVQVSLINGTVDEDTDVTGEKLSEERNVVVDENKVEHISETAAEKLVQESPDVTVVAGES